MVLTALIRPGSERQLLCEGVPGVYLAGGLHVGEEVSAAEAVNGLLGVPDQEQDGSLLSEYILENGILNRVRVLEFIDQRRLVASPDCLRKLIHRRQLQRLVQSGQEVIEELDISSLLPCRKLMLDASEYLPFEVKKLLVHLCLKHRLSLLQFITEVKKGMPGRLCSLFSSSFPVQQW